jgi:UDP-N-acetylmuramoylalanine--D-glutamate ligase
MSATDFESGRIAILGIGREGQAAREYLRSQYPDIDLSLLAEAEPDRALSAVLSDHDQLYIGPLSQAGLEKFDILVRSPGVSPYRKCIQNARAAGVRLTTPSNLWFAGHENEQTVCITGTKGKSTTSALLAHILQSLGYRVRLAGNIGLPLLACDDRDVDWWIIELSSYQLADLEARPGISVILNLSPEHLDWHGSEQAYLDDKLRLAELAGDRPLVLNAGDSLLAELFASRGNVSWFNSVDGIRAGQGGLFDAGSPLAVVPPEGLPGAHNLSNTAAALTVLRIIDEDITAAGQSISSFRSLPHRLQMLGEKAGIRYVNDSISSTPVATVAALEALGGQVTLLLGGLDRGLDWTPYMGRIKARLPASIIGIPDNGPRVIGEMRQAGITPPNGLHESENLVDAVELAKELTPQGGLVLLSPGAPSFPQFRDFSDRGRQFTELCDFIPEQTEPFQTGKK